MLAMVNTYCTAKNAALFGTEMCLLIVNVRDNINVLYKMSPEYMQVSH